MVAKRSFDNLIDNAQLTSVLDVVNIKIDIFVTTFAYNIFINEVNLLNISLRFCFFGRGVFQPQSLQTLQNSNLNIFVVVGKRSSNCWIVARFS